MALATAFTLTSCEDWLEMPSESKADSNSAFETLSRAEMAVVGAYNQLHSQELGYQLLMGTDECVSTESNSKYNVSNYDYTNLSAMLSNTYTQMYKAIEYSNVCIAGLEGKPADQKRNQLLGEALAIRAYAYWNLVRFYGDVPYNDRPTSELSTFASSRVSRDVIYDHCIDDLKQAVDLLAWRSEGVVPTTERFTKNAAYGILARVALYAAGKSLRWDLSTYDPASLKIAQRDDAARVKELYQIAADACKAVIDKGENGLLPKYDQVFRDLGNQTYNKETMLEYGMFGANAMDVRTGYTNGMPVSGTSTVIGKCAAQMMAMPTFYFEYEEGDQRRDVSVCNVGIAAASSGDKYQLATYAGMGVGKYRVNWKKARGASDSKRDYNWSLLRYSDVLLMYAEALNEVNGAPNAAAIDAVKQVRKRAFNGDEAKIGTIPTSHDEFLNYIIQERKLELNCEGLRKTDLTRWGIQYEYLTAEKAKLVDLCNHAGKYASVKQYWAYKQPASTPCLNDPIISIAHIELSEAEVAALGLSAADMTNLHTINAGGKGAVKVKFYEAGGQVYYTSATAPEGATAVEYTILNMWGINSIKQKGNLSVVDNTNEANGMISSNNAWITGATGLYYGLKKNCTEILPFHSTNIVDVNPGLAGQQHPGYK